MKKSKLLLSTFDAQLIELILYPKYNHTKVSYKLKIYEESLYQNVTKTISFEDVLAIEFHINYFDALTDIEVRGFYEIFEREEKEAILERNFLSRKNQILFHGDYNYDPKEPNDLLNNRESIECILKELDEYHLLEQQTTGGIYLFLAKKWVVE